MSQAVLEHPIRAEPERRALDGTATLSVALLASGLLTYAFHVLAARSLGPEAYGRIAVLWASMFLAAVVLFRPLEQTASRALADRLARGEEGWTVVRSVAHAGAGVLAAVAIGALAGGAALSHRLFPGDPWLTALLGAGVLLYAVAYVVRGLLAGTGWFGGYGAAVVADAVLRLLLAVPLLVIASEGLAAGATVAAGAAGIAVPLLLGHRRLAAAFAGKPGPRFRIGAALGFAAPAGIVAAADQLLVNGGAVLVMVAGGPGAATAAAIVFAATMIVRIPVYLFQGVAASLLPNLTRLQALDDTASFRRAILRTAGVLLACGAAVVVFGASIGPEVMRMLYGEGFDAGHVELALLGAGVGCYLAAATLSQALLALDRTRAAAAAWAVVALGYVGLYAVLPGTELRRVSIAFALAAATGLLLLVALVVRRRS